LKLINWVVVLESDDFEGNKYIPGGEYASNALLDKLSRD
jgi:hypothetical protein